MLNVISGAEEVENSRIYTNSKFHNKAIVEATPLPWNAKKENLKHRSKWHPQPKRANPSVESSQVPSFGMAVKPCPCQTSTPAPREKNLVVQAPSNMRLGAAAQEADAIWTTALMTNGPSQSLYPYRSISRVYQICGGTETSSPTSGLESAWEIPEITRTRQVRKINLS